MLDTFLKVAYEGETRRQAEFEALDLMKGLPDADLRKLAGGTPTAELYGYLEKTGSLCSSDDSGTFLDRFKGTPLLDQALALEQEELQLDMLDQQRREEEHAMRDPQDIWMKRDKLRLQKRMLELDLAKAQAAPAPVAEPAQGAGVPGEVPAEGVQDSAQGLQGGVAKMSSAKTATSVGRKVLEFPLKHPVPFAAGALAAGVGGGLLARHYGLSDKLKEHGLDDASMLERLRGGAPSSAEEKKIAFAENMGRTLARADMEKAAHVQQLRLTGMQAGQMMAKTALGMGVGKIPDMLSRVPGMASKALGWAAQNPTAVGAVGGGIVGGLAAPKGHALAGMVGGAGLGAGAGYLGKGTMAAMKANPGMNIGQGLRQSAGNAFNQLKGLGGSVQQNAQGLMGKLPTPPVAAPGQLSLPGMG